MISSAETEMTVCAPTTQGFTLNAAEVILGTLTS